MIRKIVSFSVEHPISIICIILAICISGIFCTFFINTDLLPELSCRKIIVTTEYKGMSSEDMRILVTIPLEDTFSSLKGLKNISSISRDGFSLITIELHWGTDCDMALVESRELIDICYQSLPTGCNKPIVRKDNGLADTISLAIIPTDNDMLFARHITETEIKPRLQRLEGSGSVKIYGGEEEEISVIVENNKLIANGLTLEDIASSISMANVEYPAGTITEKDKDFMIKTCGLFDSLEDIKKLPISYSHNIIPLENIASVFSSIKEKETFFLYNGKPAIRIGINKKNEANPITLSKDVKALIRNFETQYSDLFSFVILDDLSTQVSDALISLLISACIGIIVTFFVVLFFLKSLNVALLLSSVIPICSSICLICLNLTGCSLNIMSLSGIAVGIGMVVDAGAVTLENLERKKSKLNSISKKEIIDCVLEISLSTTGSTITTIIVFLPVFFLEGILGEVFFDMAISIVCAIAASCLLSLSYIPALYSILSKTNSYEIKSNKVISIAEMFFDKILRKILKRKFLAVIPILICTLFSFISLFFLDLELLPKIKNDIYQIQLDFPVGLSINKLEKIGEELTFKLNEDKNLIFYAIYGGMESEDYQRLASAQENFETIFITVKSKKISNKTKDAINQIAQKYNGSIKLSEKQDMLSIILDLPGKKNIISEKSIQELNDKLIDFDDLTIYPNKKTEEIVFIPDRIFCSRLSTNPTYVASLIRNSLEGIEASQYYKNDRQIPINVKLSESKKLSSESILDLNVKINMVNIPFNFLGEFKKQENEKVLYRYNRKDSKIICDFSNEDITKIKNKKCEIFDLSKYETQEMFSNGIILLIVCALLLYFVMGSQFQSFYIPFLLLLALPPAFFGGIIFLLIFNQTLNIHGVIALVILFGTSVNNSILLYESCCLLKSISNNSILTACRKKLRGILVTNTSTIFALIPFAFNFSGKNTQASMALCIIGGLITSTIVVLTVIPVIFSVVLKRGNNE